MKLRASFAQVLLALVLLFSQQVGMAHAITHLAEPLQRTSQDQQLPGEHACDQCVAFASIGSALASAHVAFAVAAADNANPVIATSVCFIPATVLPFHTRAPPFLA